jgi:hypothetical protein
MFLGGLRRGPNSLQSVDECKEFLDAAYALVDECRPLIDAHGLDIRFLASDHYSLLPASFQSLERLSPEELAKIPLGTLPADGRVTPEFVAFAERAFRCQLDPSPQALRTPARPCHVRHFIGTTEKKRDEMLAMAHLVHEIAADQGAEHVTDLGCGKGYLSTLLAANYGLSVLGIEQSDETARAAELRNEHVQKKLPKASRDAELRLKVRSGRIKLGPESMAPEPLSIPHREAAALTTAVSTVDAELAHSFAGASAETTKQQQQHQQQQQQQQQQHHHHHQHYQHQQQQQDVDLAAASAVSAAPPANLVCAGPARPSDLEQEPVSLDAVLGEEGVQRSVLVGLHICGDLTPDAMRLALGSPRVCGAVLCGCCYNMLTEDEAHVLPFDRFPMSSHARGRAVKLGRRLRNAACHSVHEWTTDPAGWCERVLYTSVYRALLGNFMAQRGLATALKWGRTFQNVKRRPAFGVWAAGLLAQHIGTYNGSQVDCEHGGEAGQGIPAPTASETADIRPLPAAKAVHPSLPADPAWDAAALQAFYDAHAGSCMARMLVFETVAGLILPVLESVVVVDRLLFLLEHGVGARLLALFNPSQSPRNWVIVIQK